MIRPSKYSTANKDILLEIIKNVEYDFTAKDICNLLKNYEQNIALSTVYRIIDELFEDNVILKTLDNSNIAHYRYIVPCNDHDHLLLKCSKCSSVYHISCDIVNDLNSHLLKEHNFLIKANNVFLPGICKNCMKEEDLK